jgi:hypothetical protein
MCDCGEITDIEAHLLEWVVDKAATNTIIGTKHLECSCGYRTEENTTISIPDKQKFLNQLTEDFGSDTVEFTAIPFAQYGVLSYQYSIDVKIIGGEIYMNGHLYDDVKIVGASDIIYDESILDSSGKSVTDEERTEIIKELQKCEICYLIETQSNNVQSKIVAVHKIGENYYFSSFLSETDGIVIRVHYTNIRKVE